MRITWQGTLPADLFRDDPVGAYRHARAELEVVAALRGVDLPEDATVRVTNVRPAYATVASTDAPSEPPTTDPPYYSVTVDAEVPDAD